jgi:dTMP kinase
MNALDLKAMDALCACIEWCVTLDQESDQSQLAGVILTGGGDSFIAGGDLKALSQLRGEEGAREMSSKMQGALTKLSALSCPVFSAIEGFAIGGGAEIALSTDLCVISEDAHFRFAHRSLGLCTGWGAGRRLAQIVGARRALALLASGHKITAQEAYSMGISHRLCPAGNALHVALNWALKLAETPEATRSIKSLMSAYASPSDRDRELTMETELFAPLWAGDEHWAQVDRFWAQRDKKKSVNSQSGDRALAPITPLTSRESIMTGKSGVGVSWSEDERESVDDHLSSLSSKTRGAFIVLEGIDGAGTTTQGERITRWLTDERHTPAVFTCEPSLGVLGQVIRRALRGETIGRGARTLPLSSIALLFAADRADHWSNEIEPLLSKGTHVICDRYLYSSLAYQGCEHPESWVRALNAPFPKPDITLYIKVPSSVATARRNQRGEDADHYENSTLLREVATRYDRICKEAGATEIDGAQPIDIVYQQCLAALKDVLSI